MRGSPNIALGLLLFSAGCGPAEPERQSTALPRVADSAPLARMTHAQYANTVRDLFAPAEIMPPAFPREREAAGGFRNNAQFNAPTGPLVEAVHRAAVLVAEQAVEQRGVLMDCDLESPACGHAYLSDLAVRAWRRGLSSAETAQLLDGFDTWSARHGAVPALQLAIERLLLSPEFLYLPRFGLAEPDATSVGLPLTSWEMASRLSYFLWNSAPDEALLELARADRLRSRDVVIAQAWRMLADPRGQAMVVAFHRELLDFEAVGGVGLDLEHYAGAFGDEQGYEEDDIADYYYLEYLPMLRYEPEVFVAREVFGEGSGTLAGLLTSTRTWVTRDIATIAYGAPLDTHGGGVPWIAQTDLGALGGEFYEESIFDAVYYPLELPAEQRAGVLTLASVLSSHAGPRQPSPVGRGVAVLDRLLCTTLSPPGDVPPLEQSLEGLDPQTNRDKYDIHQAADACGGCHRIIDGIGFAFEHYDSMGRWRELDNGHPVDATGQLVGVDVEGSVDGAVQLAQALAQSRDVHDCYVRQWFRWGFGRNETDDDAPTLTGLADGFWESGGDIQELVVNIAGSHQFRHRRAP